MFNYTTRDVTRKTCKVSYLSCFMLRTALCKPVMADVSTLRRYNTNFAMVVIPPF